MIIKVISHNNMKRSAGYLFHKAEVDPIKTGMHPAYALQSTKEEFISAIEQLRDMRFDDTRRKSHVNNQIKHLVISVHPTEREKFENIRDEILEKLFKEIGIEPENHLMNVFIHDDTAHPHIHLLFSRIGEDMSVVKYNDIGEQLGEFAESISKEYGFIHGNPSPKITFNRQDLYRPTDRTALLKLIDFALKDATSVQRYREVLKNHGVTLIKKENGEIAYQMLNPKLVPKEDIPEKILDAKKFMHDKEQYEKTLLKSGIEVKWNELDQPIYSTKRFIYLNEANLPEMIRHNHLARTISELDHDPEYLKLRETISKGVEKCETLKDIKELLPGCEIFYKRVESRFENISLVYGDHYIRLHEAFEMDVRIDETRYYSNPLEIPIIFFPSGYSDKEFEEELQKMRAMKYGKRSKMIGPNNREMNR